MKLIALYNVFNTPELLKQSIEQIKPYVDEIILCYSTHSHYGEEIPEKTTKLLKSLKDVHLLPFTPDVRRQPHDNSKAKVKLRLELAKGLGATHFILLAEDHYYKPQEFKEAKEFIENNPNIDVSLTSMYTYFKKPTWQIFPIEDYYMPFICKLYKNTRPSLGTYPYRTDPSVRVEPAHRFHLFKEKEIMLHHFSMVRSNIEDKFRNAAASSNWKPRMAQFIDDYDNYDIEENFGVKYFKSRKIKEVENYFSISV
jgi:hypothetical protein